MEGIALFFLASVAVGGVAWVFVYPIISGERKAEQRMASVAKAEPVARAVRNTQRSRRDTIETTLKEIEVRHQKTKNIPLSVRITRAGLSWSKQRYFLISAAIGAVMFFVGLTSGGTIVGAVLGAAGALALPRWLLSYLKKRRENKFLASFPDAVDIIVRGVKAGLPLREACAKLYEHMPLPEANFFGIVVSIQQRSGGNLAEALGNLSRVLRDRKKMKAKIQAMSQEAKASAAIIGALPLAVMTLVYITSPNYISLLWTEPLGRVMLAASAVWMFMGVMVMKKMINFDF